MASSAAPENQATSGPEQLTSPPGRGKVPRYLLIVGSPESVPWHLQLVLGHVAFTGRIDLTEAALENYVTALRDDWDGAAAKPNNAVVWAAYHGPSDITALMLSAIASKVMHRRGAI